MTAPVLRLPRTKPLFEFTSTALLIESGATLETFQEIALQINKARGCKWWAGDFVLQSERRFGEEAQQVIDQLGYEPETLSNLAWMARSFPKEERHDSGPFPLSWSHHREAAGIKDKATREAWLQKAQENYWTVGDFRKALRSERHGETESRTGTPATVRIEGLRYETHKGDQVISVKRGEAYVVVYRGPVPVEPVLITAEEMNRQ